jgi:TonB-linked SusC/RagA family outer membrane protein
MEMNNYLQKWVRVPLLVLCMLASSWAFAQRTVSGTIYDSGDGSPLPGVNILVRGTTIGTISDIDGKYNLAVPDGNSVLIFSFVGFKSQEINIGSQTTIDVRLELDMRALEEIVVTGYSVDTRRETTGSVSTVKAKDLVVVPSGNVEQQLQGRVAGVTVITNGQPGTASVIRVRGFGSFGGNEPLYIVDGVPVGSTDFLNPDDIETVTVLKDAAAASIYGARAANGVIVYTTKKGRKGAQKLTVNYDGMVGFTDPGPGQPMLNPQDFATWTWNAIRNAAVQNNVTPTFNHPQFGTGANPVIPQFLLVGSQGGITGNVDLNAERERWNVDPEAGPIYQVIRANLAGTDWYDEITRIAPIQRHSLGMSGGGENNRFYVGLGVQEQDGILLHQKFRRYSLRANSEFDLVPKKVRVGQNFQATYRQVRLLQGGQGGQGSADDENVILAAFRMPSIIPVYDEFGGYAGTRAPGFNNPRNPVAELDGARNNRGFSGNAFGNMYIEVEPIENLVVRSSIGGSYTGFYSWGYGRRQYENSENNASFSYNENGGFVFGWTLTNTVNYKKKIGRSTIDLLAGQEALNSGAGRNMGASGLNPFSQDPDFVTISTTPPATRIVNSNYFKGVNFASYFGQAKYTYNDKYLATVVVRRDGSSRFGSENRYGVFPAFSAAWRVSEESFLKGSSFINDLMIRGGWGIMGNSNNVDPNNQFSLFGTGVGPASYDIGGTNNTAADGFFRSRIGNPAARWERAVTTNIGIQSSILNNRVELTVDVWRKDSDDLLFQVPITRMNGLFAAAPAQNVGKMRNQGIDIEVVTRGKVSRDFTYEVRVQGGFLQNEIVSLAPGIEFLTTVNPSFRGIEPIRNQVGRPISSFFGYQTLGLFQNQAEVDNSPTQAGAAPGRFRFADVNGDGAITAADRTWLGSPVPDFTGGINLNLGYKNFTLDIYGFASIGGQIFNMSKWYNHFYPSFAGAAIHERVKESWTFDNPNPNAAVPIFENVSNFSTNTQSNSWYVEDGSYFRLQNISLGYEVPKVVLNKLKVDRLRVFAAANNIFTITGYSGLDPMVAGDADTRLGIDIGNIPLTRSYTFGINLGF